MTGEPSVFVLWERARPWQEKILSDLRRRFVLATVVEVTWPPASFSRNLTRLYGQALPPGSDKEEACGTGPFLVVVAVDEHPRYGLRRTTGGLRRVNVRAAAAKARYRRWTGGGFRVHGSLDRAEARRDLQLLLGVEPDDVVGRRWDGVVRPGNAHGDGWTTADELLAAIDAATPAVAAPDDGATLVLRAEDVWWAAVIAGADPPADDARQVEMTVSIGGARRSVRLEQLTPASHARR